MPYCSVRGPKGRIHKLLLLLLQYMVICVYRYAIVEAQTETGNPYMLYKDACNIKSNQKNLGTIKCSNLCTEIVEYTAPDEVCTTLLCPSSVSAHCGQVFKQHTREKNVFVGV